MPINHVFYHKSPLHANNYVLSFAFCFDKEDEVRWPVDNNKIEFRIQG
jgi:hypothetical protein